MSSINRIISTLKIENIVASTSLNNNIDISRVSNLFESSEYDPEHFPGVIIRLKEPSSSVLVFRSGKLISTGAKGFEAVEEGISRVIKEMNMSGITSNEYPHIKYQNIVFSADLGVGLNLNKVALGLGLENVEYEPEKFPGLVYRLFVPKVVILIFSTGKMVITGCKEYLDAQEALEILVRDLEEQSIIMIDNKNI